MSERTTTSVATQSQTTTPAELAAQHAAFLAHVSAVQLWTAATPAERDVITADYRRCLADGIPLAEYVEALSTWGGDAASYIAECGYNVGDADTEAVDSDLEPTSSVDTVTEPAPVTAPAAPEPTVDENAPSRLLRDFAKHARNQATALLNMGLLGVDYIRARMALSTKVKREACVKCLVSAWQEHSDGVITSQRVNDLLRLAATWMAFNTVTAFKPGKVAVRVVREFNPLVERLDGTAEESRITPSLEERGRALWLEATGKGLKGEECAAAVADLIAAHKAEIALRAQQHAQQHPTDTAAQQHAEQAQRDADKATDNAVRKHERTDKPETTPPATVNPTPETPAIVTPAAPTVAPTATVNPAAQGTPVMGNLHTMAKAGTAKDIAGMAAELVTGGDEPDSVVEELLKLLSLSGELSKTTKRALNAALVVLNRPESSTSSTALVPSSNGHAIAPVVSAA